MSDEHQPGRPGAHQRGDGALYSPKRSGGQFIDSAERSGAPSIDSPQQSGAPSIDSPQRSGGPFIDARSASQPLFSLRVCSVTSDDPSPYAVLRDAGGARYLEVPLTTAEARALAAAQAGIALSLPSPQDLLAQVMAVGGLQLLRVELRSAAGARLLLRGGDGNEHVLPARAADAVGLALRLDLPVWVAEQHLSTLGGAPRARSYPGAATPLRPRRPKSRPLWRT